MGSYAFTVSAEDLDKVQQHMAAVRSMEPASEWKGSIEIHFVLHGVFPCEIQDVCLPYRHEGADRSTYTDSRNVKFLWDFAEIKKLEYTYPHTVETAT